MPGAIKLPSSGVSRINSSMAATLCRGHWAQLFGSLWCSQPQQGRNQLSSSVYANKTLRHGSGIQHIWIKNAQRQQ